MIEKISTDELLKLENGTDLILEGQTFTNEELLIFRECVANSNAVTNRFITISMDCTLDQELIDEGLAREMINRIQKSRKEMNFNVADRISISIKTTPHLEAIFTKHLKYISQETLIHASNFTQTLPAQIVSHDIEGELFELSLKKAN